MPSISTFQIISSSLPQVTNETCKKNKNLSKTQYELNKLPKTGRWTPEARVKQAARIRLQKPWEHSTGPKTAAGKKKSSRNNLKHGQCCASTKRFNRILRGVKKYQKKMRMYYREERQKKIRQYQIDLNWIRCLNNQRYFLYGSLNTLKFQHRPVRIRLAKKGTMSNLFP